MEQEKKRNPAYERDIKDIKPESDVRVRIIGTVISKSMDSSSIVIDDSTGQLTVLISSDELLEKTKPGQFVRIIGLVVPYEGGFELRAEIVQDMSLLDKELYKKYKELAINKI